MLLIVRWVWYHPRKSESGKYLHRRLLSTKILPRDWRLHIFAVWMSSLLPNTLRKNRLHMVHLGCKNLVHIHLKVQRDKGRWNAIAKLNCLPPSASKLFRNCIDSLEWLAKEILPLLQYSNLSAAKMIHIPSLWLLWDIHLKYSSKIEQQILIIYVIFQKSSKSVNTSKMYWNHHRIAKTFVWIRHLE